MSHLRVTVTNSPELCAVWEREGEREREREREREKERERESERERENAEIRWGKKKREKCQHNVHIQTVLVCHSACPTSTFQHVKLTHIQKKNMSTSTMDICQTLA